MANRGPGEKGFTEAHLVKAIEKVQNAAVAGRPFYWSAVFTDAPDGLLAVNATFIACPNALAKELKDHIDSAVDEFWRMHGMWSEPASASPGAQQTANNIIPINGRKAKKSPALGQPEAGSAGDLNQGCYGGSGCANLPEFRLVELAGEGTTSDGEHAEEGIFLTKMCRDCAISEARDNLDVMQGDVKAGIPTLGFMLLPLYLSSDTAEDLKVYLAPEFRRTEMEEME